METARFFLAYSDIIRTIICEFPSMYIEDEKIKEFILDSGLLSDDEIDTCLKNRRKKTNDLGTCLINQGKITDEDLKRVQAYLVGIPFVDISKEKIDYDILSMIPEPVARNHNIIAYKRERETLDVAMLDTDDLPAIDFIKKKTKLDISPRLTSATAIKAALLQYQKNLKENFGDIIKDQMSELNIISDSADSVSVSDLKKIADDLPVIRIVDTLIRHAISQNASDIHVEPSEEDLLVRYRIDGVLHDAMRLPKESILSIIARIKVLADLKLDEKRLPQDGRFKIDLNGEKVSFRVSVMPTYFGEKIVIRILREGAGEHTLETLGLFGDALEHTHDSAKLSSGMVLVTGPTGCGKTTTLYTLVEMLNSPEINIATIEDPIEYQIPRVNQTQVKPEIDFHFSDGLRSLVRQDPDIIMVGEIRDKETADLAINASLTGHLVFSSLHTNDAPGAIPRLLDLGAEKFLITSTVKYIVAQRLVRRLTHKKEGYKLSKSGLKALEEVADMEKVLKILKKEKIVKSKDTWKTIKFFRAVKSAESESGYKGRVGIFEVMPMSESIKELVMSGASEDKISDQAKKEGMLTMIEDGIIKAVQGITTIEEVMRVTSE